MSRRRSHNFDPLERAVGMHASVPEWLDIKARNAVHQDPDPEIRGNFSAWMTKLLIDKLGPRDSN
jgi:hypothetical protein